jgi:hypothetical protein
MSGLSDLVSLPTGVVLDSTSHVSQEALTVIR